MGCSASRAAGHVAGNQVAPWLPARQPPPPPAAHEKREDSLPQQEQQEEQQREQQQAGPRTPRVDGGAGAAAEEGGDLATGPSKEPGAPRAAEGTTGGERAGAERAPRAAVSAPAQLLRAAKDGDVAAARAALSEDAGGVNHRGVWGNTPLICACQYGSSAVALLLLDSGANVGVINEHGCSALHHAALEGLGDVVPRLAKAVAGLPLAERERVLRPAPLYNSQNDTKQELSPLVAAATNGHVEIVDALLRASLVQADRRAEESLCALSAAATAGHVSCVKRLLLRGGSMLPSDVLRRDTRLLCEACLSGSNATLRELLAHDDCLINGCQCADSASAVVGEARYGPLAIAARAGDETMVMDLLSAGADPNYSCGRCSTPLLQACRAASVNCVVALLAQGAHANIADPQSKITALEYATNASLTDILEALRASSLR
jgi:ankyrin repeat protein